VKMIRKKRFWTITAISLFSLIMFLLGSLLFYQNAYAGKIYRNVLIAGIDVSGKTKKQATILIHKKFDVISQKQITFKAGEKSVSALLSETGLSFDIDKSILLAYEIGRSHKFFPQLYASAKTSIGSQNLSVPLKIDNTKLSLFISEKLPSLNTDSEDAYLLINENGDIEIVPEIVGQKIDTSNLADDLSELITNGNSLDIQLHAIAVPSQITSESLQEKKALAEEYLKTQINLIYENSVFTPTRYDISRWIKFVSNSGVVDVELDNNAIRSYLTQIAKNFEIAKKDKKINALDESVIEEGQQGKYLDKDGAVKSISAVFNGGSSQIVLQTYLEDPKEIRVYPAEGIIPGRFEGKYLDVDLTQQKLCQVESNTVINCFIISSGKPSMPTPTGTKYIQSKELKRWSSPYGLWMPFWQSIGGGYGIHDLPEWPNGYKEGENHLGTPVSHGCIRLGSAAAETVFNWTTIGTPVYIHK